MKKATMRILLVAAIATTATAADPTWTEVRQTPLPHDGGLVVHLGLADTALLRAATAGGTWVGLGVPKDAVTGDRLRDGLAADGKLGPASMSALPADGTVPVVSNTAMVVIADLDDLGGAAPTTDELTRALRPGGVAHVKKGGTWTSTVKPWPKAYDDWTHHHGKADYNDFSQDTAVAKASGLQWVVGKGMSSPRPTGFGVRIAAGRAIISPPDVGPRQSPIITGRDAFSGAPLWEVAVRPGSRFATILTADRFFLHPLDAAKAQPMIALDAATGKEVMRYDQGFTAAGKDYADKGGKNPHPRAVVCDGTLVQAYTGSLYALDVVSGEKLWQVDLPVDEWSHLLAAADGVVVHVQGKGRTLASTYAASYERIGLNRVVAYDLRTGAVRWTWEWDGSVKGRPEVGNIALSEGVVALGLCMIGNAVGPQGFSEGAVLVLDVTTGKKRFIASSKTEAGTRGHGYFRVHIVNGKVYVMEFAVTKAIYDLSTGKDVQKTTLWSQAFRCHPARFTPSMLIGSLSSSALDGSRIFFTEAARSPCDIGTFPAHGMIFQDTTNCGCFQWLRGAHAFNSEETTVVDDLQRLRRGESAPAAAATSGSWPTAESWPLFLRDGSRSRWAAGAHIAPKPTIAWTSELAGATDDRLTERDRERSGARMGRLTPFSVAEGIAVGSLVDTHTIIALDPASGTTRWRRVVDGMVDCAPTIWNGIVLAGTQHGMVYALNRDTGEVIWSFFAGARNRRLVADGVAAAVSPVHGSVQIIDGVAWCFAGREVTTDGGLFWWGLDPATGAVRSSGRTGYDGTWQSINMEDKNRPKFGGGGFNAWGKERRGCASTPPVLYEGSLYLQRYGFDPRNGKTLPELAWLQSQASAKSPLVARPNLRGGYVNEGMTGQSTFAGVMGEDIAIHGSDAIISASSKEAYTGGRGGGGGQFLMRWRHVEKGVPSPSSKTVKIHAEAIWTAEGDFSDDAVNALAVLGDTVAVARERQLVLVDASTGASRSTIPLPGRAIGHGISGAGDTILVVLDNGSVLAIR
jgi:outer membrane protein assembly factor BamB